MVSKTAALVAPAPPEATGKPARVEASPAQTTMGSVDDGGTRRPAGCQDSLAPMASLAGYGSRRAAWAADSTSTRPAATETSTCCGAERLRLRQWELLLCDCEERPRPGQTRRS